MPPIHLSLAINDTDQVRDLVAGRVPIEGVELTALALPVEEIFFRFVRHREWDISELSLAKFSSLRAAGDESLVAIPVFTSRAFRHSAIFVRDDGPVGRPAELRGRRIGVPEWTQTATVYARGLLTHDYGVAVEDVDWTQAGTNEPGRTEGVPIALPPGVRITARPDQTLNDLLLAGELDALIAAHSPTGFTDGTGRIVRLFPDFEQVEAESYRRTGVFPIMHVVALRREVFDRDPWIAMELFKAFEEARRRSLVRMLDPNAPFTPIPWAWAHAARTVELLGDDPWPYGIEPNRATLEAFLAYAHEQGVCARRLEPEELFAPETASRYRV